MVKLNAVRLFLPDSEMRRRAGNPAALGAYIQSIKKVMEIFWTNKSPVPVGLLIAIGVKQGKKSRIWCEAVGGQIAPNVRQELEQQLTGIPPFDIENDPVAFAMEFLLSNKTAEQFPVAPHAWLDAAQKTGRQLKVPDELFKLIWMD